jgi:hypothetical protein
MLVACRLAGLSALEGQYAGLNALPQQANVARAETFSDRWFDGLGIASQSFPENRARRFPHVTSEAPLKRQKPSLPPLGC